jgi:plastocyanin
VAANTAVTWTNDSGVPHDVTFDDPTTALAVGAGSAGNITQPASGSHQRQFAVSGSSHPFHCAIHGLVMHGTVTVL